MTEAPTTAPEDTPSVAGLATTVLELEAERQRDQEASAREVLFADVLGVLPMGWLADRCRRAPIIGWASLVFGATVAACGAAVNILPIGLRGRIGKANGCPTTKTNTTLSSLTASGSQWSGTAHPG